MADAVRPPWLYEGLHVLTSRRLTEPVLIAELDPGEPFCGGGDPCTLRAAPGEYELLIEDAAGAMYTAWASGLRSGQFAVVSLDNVFAGEPSALAPERPTDPVVWFVVVPAGQIPKPDEPRRRQWIPAGVAAGTTLLSLIAAAVSSPSVPPLSGSRRRRPGRGGLGARAYNKGSEYGVSLNEGEIASFADRFPGSDFDGLRRLYASFDRRNGDLVELECNKRFGSCERWDGYELKALVDDAQCWAAAKLKHTDFQTEKCAGMPDWREYLPTIR